MNRNECKLLRCLCEKCNKCNKYNYCEEKENEKVDITPENMEKIKLQLSSMSKLLIIFGVAFLVLFNIFMQDRDSQITVALILPTCCFWILYLSWQYIDTMSIFSLKNNYISTQNQKWYEYISKAVPISVILTIYFAFVVSSFGQYHHLFENEHFTNVCLWGTALTGVAMIPFLFLWQKLYKKYIWVLYVLTYFVFAFFFLFATTTM